MGAGRAVPRAPEKLGAQPRLSGPQGRWLSGPQGRWLSGPQGRWLSGPQGRWLSGPQGPGF
ncbi:hypothetical protein F3K34_08605 [Streptomyces sp. LBUM 1486]|nr:hypothetical protein [Streptomyces sp. LBUM 1485]MBP5912383.1 hypothetical protein [Streptomyces sp. LBUM 1486]